MSENEREPEQASAEQPVEGDDRGTAERRRERPGEAWPEEIGGPRGPEPTRYGDWESNGRCSDF
ncbi:hypothetical protein KBTX_00920 [wastewater metagenome]|uniref:DUF1674 domain-containing protein n=2 Tax=unclassified sequences TaxID=12908 RepID=A0A5B8RB29_9ZZZZ|nr:MULTISPECIES: DUF1674 domain-containing protein [Arhodomonas]MCS4503603.1 DUF1674 domain-containing protein [Arhodomonas aquaeolei]QEA04612.1 hypothetical protein KBTEX_00920 [uncultured organism]